MKYKKREEEKGKRGRKLIKQQYPQKV